MSYEAQGNELRARFEANRGALPVAWPNVTYTPTEGTMWARFSIVNGDRFQIGIGNPLANNHRIVGLLYINIFAPLNAGDGLALSTADTVAAIFHNWGGTTVQCRAASVRDIGPDGQWYQVNVVVPFKRDELS